jgi:hypothetical protein
LAWTLVFGLLLRLSAWTLDIGMDPEFRPGSWFLACTLDIGLDPRFEPGPLIFGLDPSFWSVTPVFGLDAGFWLNFGFWPGP